MDLTNDDRSSKTQELLYGVVGRLNPIALSEELAVAVSEEIPSYALLPDDRREELLGNARQLIQLTRRLFQEQRAPSVAELDFFIELARQRAAEGMPLEEVLDAHWLGARRIWDAILAVIEPDEAEIVPMLAEFMFGHVQLLIAAVVNTYLEEGGNPVYEGERHFRRLFDVLCSSQGPTSVDRLLAESLRFPIRSEYSPFVVELGDAGSHGHQDLARTLRDQAMLALVEGPYVIGLAARDPQVLLVGADLLILGEPLPRAELADGIDDLRHLLAASARLGRKGRWTLAELGPEALLTRSPAVAAALRRDVVGRLRDWSLRANAPDLLETLRAFLDSGLDRGAAAKRLHVHPNTLDRRLQHVQDALGIDLHRSDDIARLNLALLAERLATASDPEIDELSRARKQLPVSPARRSESGATNQAPA